jgi:hypothetical protein
LSRCQPPRPARRSRPARRTRSTCRLQVEPLENRVVPSFIELLGHWNGATGGPLYSDGWIVDDYAFIGHYQRNNGIHIIDISDPTNPFETANFRSTTGNNDYRDVEVQWQDVGGEQRLIGYFSNDIGGGLVIADVTDVYNPRELIRITSAHSGYNSVHTLSVEGRWLYEADSRSNTIRVFDVINPVSPRWVRNIVSTVGGTVHEVTAQFGLLYTANIFDNSSAEIFDVSRIGEPGNPVTFLGVAFPGGWAHTTWPTEPMDNGHFMAVAREQSGSPNPLSFWNVANPASPQLAWQMDLREPGGCCVHQVVIRGNYMYTSWYTAGVYVHDISDPYNPVQLGHYDTFTGPPAGYNGAWGIYNYRGDYRFAAFDMQSGLFIFRINPGSAPGGGSGVFEGSGSRAVRGAWAEGLDVSAFTPEQIAELDGDILTLTLGAGDDTLSVFRNPDGQNLDVVINDRLMQFPVAQLRRLNVRALEGNDRIILDPDLNLHLMIDGGPGEDLVEGWSEAYVNPPIEHTPSIHAPKGSRYLTLAVEQVVNSPLTEVTARLLDFSAHQLLAHAEAGELESGLARLLLAGHEGVSMKLSMSMAPTLMSQGHIVSMAGVTDHLFGGLAKQVLWHKPG